MSIIKFRVNNYHNRFKREKKWQKVLFKPDRKSQIAELNELQSVINYQQQGAFSYLYFLHSPIRGLKINILDFTDDYIDVLLSAGQIYIETEVGAFFIDIESKNLRLPNEGRHSIGLLIDFATLTNDDELRDPVSGGEVTGSLGSDRLLVEYTITVNEDSYPIATLQMKGAYKIPDIYYYQDKRLTRVYNPEFISPRISEKIAQRWYEEIGNFIADGLEVSFDPKQYNLIVQPGVAYIQGKRIYLPYATFISLHNPSSGSTRFIVLLNDIGEISLIGEDNVVTVVADLPQDLIHLATFDLYKTEVDEYAIPYQEHHIVPSTNRMPLVSELVSLQAKHQETEKDLLQLALDTRALDIGSQVDLSGVFTDALTDLNRSDIYNPLFSAALMSSIRAIRTSFIQKDKTLSNLSVNSSNNILNVTKNGNPYYTCTNYTEDLELQQPVATDWLELGNPLKVIASITLSPNKGKSESQTTTALLAPSGISTLQSSILKTLATNNLTQFNIRSTIKSQEVTAECVGFNSQQDNLTLTFGNVRITQFTILQGSQGSTFGTLKAKTDGKLTVKFTIPSGLVTAPYTVSVSNNQTYAVATFNPINTVNQRALIDSLDNLPPSPTNHLYGSLNTGIGQTLFIDSPTILSSIAFKLRSGANTLVTSFGIATITRTLGGLPTNEVLGKAELLTSNINTSANGTVWSTFTFDKPVYIPTRGEYAVILTPLSAGVQLYYAQMGRADLTGGSTTEQASINGNLIVKTNDVWQADLNKDLCIKLNKAIPSSITSEIIYTIADTEQFNAVEFFIPSIIIPGTSVEFYNKEEQVWRLIDKNNFQLQTEASSAELMIKLKGTIAAFPLIEADNIHITTFKNNKNSIWISKTVEYIEPYKNIEFIFEAYTPTGATITPKFSSNNGNTWETLIQVESVLVDGNIPLYLHSYKAINLSDGTILNNQTVLRKKLTLRIDFSTTNTAVVPFVRRISSLVY